MGRMKEYGFVNLDKYGMELNTPIKDKKPTRRTKKPIEGQINFENLGISLDTSINVPNIREIHGKNIIEPISEKNLPVELRYMNVNHVAFLDPRNISYIKDNIRLLGKRKILGDADIFCKKSNEEIINSLVVFPHKTILYDYHDQKEIVLSGNILALPIKRSGDWGPEQVFIYVGNFSKDEKINSKKNTCYHPSNNLSKWRVMNLGHELPPNNEKAIRIQVSVTGINEII